VTKSLRLIAVGVATVVLLGLVVTFGRSHESASASTSPNTTTTTTQKAATAAVRWAEPVGSPPSYIFPFMPLTDYSVSNVNTFQYLMFRPLYWFGSGSTPNLNLSLSLARPPQYSAGNKTVTINLKSARWSDGEQVDARDLVFWLNMLHADKQWWAAYEPGDLPDNLSSVSTPTNEQVVLTLSTPVNPAWFTANQLSQITPLPLAWDRVTPIAAAGSGGCSGAAYGSADAACNAVFTYLSGQAGFDPANPTAPNRALASYATNPLWQIVDGPWRLSSFSSSGQASFAPNASYVGPSKPTIASFVEVPFASASSELAALSSRSIDVGYLPIQDVTKATTDPTKPDQADPALASYRLDPLYSWSINYFPYNFATTAGFGVTATIFHQPYFRQALQSLVDQPAYIARIYKGFAVPTFGPVPSYPASSTTRSLGRINPYPYDPSRAKQLLATHGWKVIPGASTSCASPGTAADQCGAGIPQGATLNFNLEYASDIPLLGQLMNAQKASWSQAGISVQLLSAPASEVVNTAVPCVSGQSCSWELAAWGVGWLFESSTYPSGDPIFATGAGSNAGSYSSTATDDLIKATISGTGSLEAYSRAVAQDLPVVFQPTPAAMLTEVRAGLSGVIPQNPLFSITPESWRF
jgi:peptide/nickel transport system substrate-binding protein